MLSKELLAIDILLPDPANARKHNEKNLDAIKGSLAKFGQQKPIVINAKNIVLAGNGTLAAAKSLGWKEIWIVKSELKGSDATAFSLADNRTAELAEWDNDILGPTLHSLREEDYDLDAIGFDASSIDKLFEEMIDEDKPDHDPIYVLTVKFENDIDQQDLFLELRDRGFKVKA